MDFVKRIAIVPFEAAIAILALGSGLTGIFKFGIVDPVNTLLPAWEAGLLNAGLIVCGICMLLGIGLGKAILEAPGLWLLIGTILARLILYGHFLHYGTNFILTGIFDLAIIIAGFVRLRSINKKQVILRVKDGDIDTS